MYKPVFLTVALLGLAACDINSGHDNAVMQAPGFLVGRLVRTAYDGKKDDLLTGGLGIAGLQSPTPPAFGDVGHPTVQELRTYAIYTNYRALNDTTTAGGFGRLYGPNIGNKNPDGKIAGVEYLSFMRLDSRHQNITLMVQIPDSFDPAKPCLITGPSSGSRGIYGAIGTVGEWALKKGCAVAYTDKGTGTGFHFLTSGKVFDLQGQLIDAVTAGNRSSFTVPLTPALKAYNEKYPYRVAVQHAHSGLNDEVNWGQYVLSSIKFAFYVMNKELAGGTEKFTAKNTLVISSSISQGGNSSLLAAEQDSQGLIDAVAVQEPNIPLPQDIPIAIQTGDQKPLTNHSRPLYDFATFLNLYQPCAILSKQAKKAPFGVGGNPAAQKKLIAHCGLLKERGLLTSETTAGQIAESVAKIREMGILDQSRDLGPINVAIGLWPTIAADYANAYGRFSVTDNLCDLSYAKVGPDGRATPQTTAEMAAVFSKSGGIAPVAGIGFAPTAAKLPLDYAICLRKLMTGNSKNALRVQKGIRETFHSGNLHGIPTIIVHGQSDGLIPVNHASRPYLGLNHIREGDKSNLRYYEISNAQHLDAFNALPGFNSRFVPLHYYLMRALDLMYDHMTRGARLPDSQVVWAVPRRQDKNGRVEDLSKENLPDILQNPGKSRITTGQGIVRIPVQQHTE